MNTTLYDYLKSLFLYEAYVLTPQEQRRSTQDKIQFIAEKIYRKKFRKRALPETTRQAIHEKIRLSVAENRPIHFVIPFGGYKHFWNSSYPEPDWAELFHFKYLTEYVSPIIRVYEPGVIIEYMSEDVILPKMNNYPEEALNRYAEVFQDLIIWYKKFIPKNLEFRFFRVRDRCDGNDIVKQVDALIPERRKSFFDLTDNEKENELHRSYRSMFWNGYQDLTHLSEEEKYKKIVDSRLIELAYYDTESKPEFMGNYLSEDNHICICFSFGTTHDNDVYQDLTLGSTYGSIVDFWIGKGMLEKRLDRFLPRIVSKKQYEDFGKIQVETLSKPFLHFKNFSQIELIEHEPLTI